MFFVIIYLAWSENINSPRGTRTYFRVAVHVLTRLEQNYVDLYVLSVKKRLLAMVQYQNDNIKALGGSGGN
jgi:hypothetical protein